jgi:hypothetical protein
MDSSFFLGTLCILYSANIQLAADSYAFAIMDGNEYKERKREQNLNVRVDRQ